MTWQTVEKPFRYATPAQAGVKQVRKNLDCGLRRNDEKGGLGTFSTDC
jgi:hypothetical protein